MYLPIHLELIGLFYIPLTVIYLWTISDITSHIHVGFLLTFNENASHLIGITGENIASAEMV